MGKLFTAPKVAGQPDNSNATMGNAVQSTLTDAVTGKIYDPLAQGTSEALARQEATRRANTANRIAGAGWSGTGLGVQNAFADENLINQNRFDVNNAIAQNRVNSQLSALPQAQNYLNNAFNVATQYGNAADINRASQASTGQTLDPLSVGVQTQIRDLPLAQGQVELQQSQENLEQSRRINPLLVDQTSENLRHSQVSNVTSENQGNENLDFSKKSNEQAIRQGDIATNQSQENLDQSRKLNPFIVDQTAENLRHSQNTNTTDEALQQEALKQTKTLDPLVVAQTQENLRNSKASNSLTEQQAQENLNQLMKTNAGQSFAAYVQSHLDLNNATTDTVFNDPAFKQATQKVWAANGGTGDVPAEWALSQIKAVNDPRLTNSVIATNNEIDQTVQSGALTEEQGKLLKDFNSQGMLQYLKRNPDTGMVELDTEKLNSLSGNTNKYTTTDDKGNTINTATGLKSETETALSNTPSQLTTSQKKEVFAAYAKDPNSVKDYITQNAESVIQSGGAIKRFEGSGGKNRWILSNPNWVTENTGHFFEINGKLYRLTGSVNSKERNSTAYLTFEDENGNTIKYNQKGGSHDATQYDDFPKKTSSTPTTNPTTFSDNYFNDFSNMNNG